MIMDAVRVFNNELSSLYESKPPISRAKMTQVTKLAIKAIKFYKHVVQSVEKFIQKCRPEYKVPGLYVIDSIVRQSRHQFGSEKDVYAPRFAKNIVNTFQFLFKCPVDERAKIVRVLNLWQKNAVFTADIIQPLMDMANPDKAVAAVAAVAVEAAEAATPVKQDKPDVKAWLSQTEPTTAKTDAPKDDTFAAVQQILQQTQQQQIQQQQLQQLQLLQQQLEKQKQVQQQQHDMSSSSSSSSNNTALVLDSTLVDQIHTLTAYLSSLTSKATGRGSSKHPNPVPALTGEPKTPGFNKALLDFDYGEDEEEDDDGKDSHVAVPPSQGKHGANMDTGVNTVQRLTEELKQAQSQQEFLRQQLRHQQQQQPPAGMPVPPASYNKLIQPPEPEAPPEPMGATTVMQDDDLEMIQMQQLQEEAATIERQQQQQPHQHEQQQQQQQQRRREHDDKEEGEIVSNHKRSRHRDKSRSKSRSPKRRHSRSRSRSGSRSRSRSKRKKRSRSRSRSRRSKRSKSRDKHERRRDRDEDEKKRDREKRELERSREKKGLPPLKEKYLSVCTKTLWIGRLPKFGAEHELRSSLEEYGPITTVDLVPPRGCAYICMENRLDAYKALEKLKRGKMFGSTAKIAWAPGKGMKEFKQYKDCWEVDRGVTYVAWDQLASDVDLMVLAEGAFIDPDTLPPGLKLDLPDGDLEETKIASGGTVPQIGIDFKPAGPIIPGLGLLAPNMTQTIPTIGHSVPNTLQAMPVGTRMPAPVPPPVSQPQEMARVPVFQGGVFPPFMGYSPQMPPPGFRFPPGFQSPPTTANSTIRGVPPPSGVPPPVNIPRGVPPPSSQPGLLSNNIMKPVTSASEANQLASTGGGNNKLDFKIPGLGGDSDFAKALSAQGELPAMMHQLTSLVGPGGAARQGFPIPLSALRGVQPGITPTTLMSVPLGQAGFNLDIRRGMPPPPGMVRPPPLSVSQQGIVTKSERSATSAAQDDSRTQNEKGDPNNSQVQFAVPKLPASVLGKFKEPLLPGKKDVDMREEKGNRDLLQTGGNQQELLGLPSPSDQDKTGGFRPPLPQEFVLADGSNRFAPPGTRLMRPIMGIQGQPLIQRAVAPGFRMRLPGQPFPMQGQVIRIPNHQGLQHATGPQLQLMGMRQLHPGMMAGSVRGILPPPPSQGIPTTGGMPRQGSMPPPGGIPQAGRMPPPQGGMLPHSSMPPPPGPPQRGVMPPPSNLPPSSRLQPRASQPGQQEADNPEANQPSVRGGPSPIEGGRAELNRNTEVPPERPGGSRSRWGPPIPAPGPPAERGRMTQERRAPLPEPLMGKAKEFSDRDIDMRERKWPDRGWQDRDDRHRVGMRDQDWRMPSGGRPRGGPDWARDMDDRSFHRPEDRDMRRQDFDRDWKRPGDRDLGRDRFRHDNDHGREIGERNIPGRDQGGFSDYSRIGRDRERDKNRNRERDHDKWDRDRRDHQDDTLPDTGKESGNDIFKRDKQMVDSDEHKKNREQALPSTTASEGPIGSPNKPVKNTAVDKDVMALGGQSAPIVSSEEPLKSPDPQGKRPSSDIHKEPEIAAEASTESPNPPAVANYTPSSTTLPGAPSPKGLYAGMPEAAIDKPVPREETSQSTLIQEHQQVESTKPELLAPETVQNTMQPDCEIPSIKPPTSPVGNDHLAKTPNSQSVEGNCLNDELKSDVLVNQTDNAVTETADNCA